MATNVVGTSNAPAARTAWGAIFGGTFVYLAIMATFGALGAAIFADAHSPAGMVVWMTILGIISLYFAGRSTGRLAEVADRNTGMYHGLITFGMCVFSTVLVLALIWGSTVGGTAQTASTVNRWDVVSVAGRGGWGLFIALFLGMIACASGASHAVRRPPATVTERPDIRRVA